MMIDKTQTLLSSLRRLMHRKFRIRSGRFLAYA